MICGIKPRGAESMDSTLNAPTLNAPTPRKSRMSETHMGSPRVHGLPPQIAGSIEIR